MKYRRDGEGLSEDVLGIAFIALVPGVLWPLDPLGLCFHAFVLDYNVISCLIVSLENIQGRQACSGPSVWELSLYPTLSAPLRSSRPSFDGSPLPLFHPGSWEIHGHLDSHSYRNFVNLLSPGNNLASSFLLLILCNGGSEYEGVLLLIFNLETHFWCQITSWCYFLFIPFYSFSFYRIPISLIPDHLDLFSNFFLNIFFSLNLYSSTFNSCLLTPFLDFIL